MILINHRHGFVLIFFILFNRVATVDIQCDFSHDDFDSLSGTYACSVETEVISTAKNTQIDSIRGYHSYSRSIDNVLGFSVRSKEMQYMLTNLGEKFKNLIAIRIRSSKLKEIHQTDLKPFTKLSYLNLDMNVIEVLEGGLFKFNPELEVIWFEGNRIKGIGQTTFDNLNKLRDVDLSSNVCVSRRKSDSYGMASFLSSIKTSCFVPEPTTTTTTTTMQTPHEVAAKSSKNFLSFGILWIILGIAAICLLAATNVLLFLRFYRKKTVVIKPIEPEDF